jgi:O-antigen ligase
MFSFKEFISSRAMMISTLLFLFPLCINTLRHWASSIFILIFLFSISAVKQYKWDLKKEEKIFLLILLLHVLTVLVSNLLAGWTYASNRWFFAGEIRLLLAIPIYLYLRQIPDIWNWLLRGIPFGAAIIGLTGIIDFSMRYSTGNIDMIFAEGAYGHIFQGNIAVLLSVFSFLAIDYFKDDKLFYRLCIAGAVLALMGAVLSVARNAWLSIVVLYFIAFMARGGVSKYSTALSMKRIVIIIAILIPALYFLSGIDYVKARFERVVEEPVAYFNADRSKPIPFTSIGFRLEQWRGVLLAFEEKPLLGHGVGNMGKVTNALIREGKINRVVYLDHTEKTGRPTHVHSAYFEYLGDAGLIGLSFTLLMIGYPMYVAVKKRKRNNHAWKFVFIHGFAFAIASLTEVPFIRNNWTSVFLVFGLVFFVWLIHESDASQDAVA